MLGEGGMGVVWRARDLRLGRSVALKLLSPESVGSDVARTRLVREARAAAALEHDGIVRVYDVGETDDGGAYLVMELVRGVTFRTLLDRQNVTVGRKVQIVAEAGRALAVAHAAGIIHRDVKPDNIMIREDGRVTVVDFGVAKPIAKDLEAHRETVPAATSSTLTGVGQLVGTPAYLAPEQARGDRVTAAADQFALAVTGYEALTGRLPWRGNGVVEVVASLLRDDPAPVSSEASVPEVFDAVFRRALAKAEKDRFPNADAFADALEDAALSLPDDQRASLSMRVEVPSARPRSPAATTPADSKERRRGEDLPVASTNAGQTRTAPGRAETRPQRTKIIVALAGVVLVAAGVLAFQKRIRSAAPQPTVQTADRAVVACPPFEVKGMEEPWLGSAAAGIACERVQLARGGLDARTLATAELLEVPRKLGSAIGRQTVEGADARARAVARAKEQTASWIDGTVEKTAAEFAVHVVLRSPGGEPQATAEGHGVELYEAVRGAITPLFAREKLANEDARELEEWLDVRSLEEVTELMDVRGAVLAEDLVALKEACARAAERTSFAPRVRYLTKSTCARKLRTGPLDEAAPPLDESTPGALITSALGRGTMGGPEDVRTRAAKLEAAREAATTIEGKARLSAAAAELYYLIGDSRATGLSFASVQSSPKAYDWRTSSWHRLIFTADADGSHGDAMAAWQSWEPVSQSFRAAAFDPNDPRKRTTLFRRAYLLGQRGYFANAYGSELLNIGDIAAARAVAEATGDDHLRMTILLAEAKYRAALEKVPVVLASLPADDASAAPAFRIAQVGARSAMTLGAQADFVAALVDRYVASEPHHVVDGVVPFVSLVATCCIAPRPVGKRCIARLQQLRAEAKIPTIFNGVETVLAGAARFVEGDYAGAAKVWRTMLRAPGFIQDPLRDPMAIAFDRAGSPELGDEIDGPTVAYVDLQRTGELAWVRAAKRAEKRGDHERARKLAQASVDKWRFADEDIPAMGEMKQLLARLPH